MITFGTQEILCTVIGDLPTLDLKPFISLEKLLDCYQSGQKCYIQLVSRLQ